MTAAPRTPGRTRDLPLAEARRLIARAIDKAEQLGIRGAIAVYGGSGALVSVSRMDRGGAGGMARARSKAWISATQQIPSAEHLHRMTVVAPPVERGFQTASPEALFPGAGGMPLARDGEVVGGIAASGATVSPFFPGSLDPRTLLVEGRPANPEDLVIHYALELPYVGQHGDDLPRFEATFGPLSPEYGAGTGMDPAPAATSQYEHAWAVRLADRAIAAAEERGLRIAVAITDHRGDAIQQDAMDGAPTAASFVALALAATASTFQVPSAELSTRLPGVEVRGLLPYPVLAVGGGHPVAEGGEVVAGLGIAGPDPAVCDEIARALADGR